MGSSGVSRTQDLSMFLPCLPWRVQRRFSQGSKVAVTAADSIGRHEQILRQSREIFPSMHLSFQGKTISSQRLSVNISSYPLSKNATLALRQVGEWTSATFSLTSGRMALPARKAEVDTAVGGMLVISSFNLSQPKSSPMGWKPRGSGSGCLWHLHTSHFVPPTLSPPLLPRA